jgi:hypothetical protein
MPLVSSSVIGEFPSRGFVEALVSVGVGSSLRVCVLAPKWEDRTVQLQRADELLPALVAQIPEAQAAVNRELGESGAIVLDVWVQVDGTASYTCGFLEGDREGKLFRVAKEGERYRVSGT